MREWQSQSHARWYCRYHIVIVPKYRQTLLLDSEFLDLL
jgi:putative transposase